MGQRRLMSRLATVVVFAALGAALAAAELANVILKDGTRLRGDVTTTDTEIVVSNAAGEVRYKKGEVAEVEWASAPGSLDEEYLRRVRVLAPEDLNGHFVIAEWAREKERFDLVRKQCTYILGLQPDHPNARLLLEFAQRKLAEQENRGNQPPRAPDEHPRAGAGLAEPGKLAELDITRLKMFEFPRSAAPKNVRIRLLPQRGAPDLIELVKRDLSAAGTLDGSLRELLDKGKPAEQLAAIVETTGGKYASRIDITGDPPSFNTFRRKVLPIVSKGCATAGCHGGENAVVFRLPGGASASDAHVYTTFLILDQLPTRFGPLIDRKSPERSALLTFMLPRTATEQPHPPVTGEKFTPRLRGERDPNYEAIRDWIESLRSPHPEYALDFAPPDWLAELRQRSQPPAEAPPTSQPTTEPAGDGGG